MCRDNSSKVISQQHMFWASLSSWELEGILFLSKSGGEVRWTHPLYMSTHHTILPHSSAFSSVSYLMSQFLDIYSDLAPSLKMDLWVVFSDDVFHLTRNIIQTSQGHLRFQFETEKNWNHTSLKEWIMENRHWNRNSFWPCKTSCRAFNSLHVCS